MLFRRLLVLLSLGLLLLVQPAPAGGAGPELVPHEVRLADGRVFRLQVARGFRLRVAAEGLRRVRFVAQAPDGRLFVTDMYNRADNRRGPVYVLEGFDPATGRFAAVKPYLTGLRNPNSIAFYVDAARRSWFYVALTDKLVRYPYVPGSSKADGTSQVIATFPDYGLDYKYGGWHLTRTIAFSPAGKLYVSVGSSCNACEEKEVVRASILEMEPDGRDAHHFATGLRNAVGLGFVGDRLYATNMGADHLGDTRPNDTFLRIQRGQDYGWPCYVAGGKAVADPRFAAAGKSCAKVPPPAAYFPAHASPLGFAWFGADSDPLLRDSFLVALHGSSKRALDHGYRVVIVREGEPPRDLISGFLEGRRTLHGRPADVFRLGPSSFLVTDDYAGVIYHVSRD